MRAPLRLAGTALVALFGTSACTAHLFSGTNEAPDASRPVVRIETRGGVEQGVATPEGLLFLGRTSTSGPCRVHYFLGKTPVVEDGTIVPFGGLFYRADVELKQQRAEFFTSDLAPETPLFALVHRGNDVLTVPVRLARGEGLAGDLLEGPGQRLPAGTGIFTRAPEREGLWQLAGLVTAEATLQAEGGERTLVVFAGVDRIREALATPQPWPEPMTVRHRMDDISITKRQAEVR